MIISIMNVQKEMKIPCVIISLGLQADVLSISIKKLHRDHNCGIGDKVKTM